MACFANDATRLNSTKKTSMTVGGQGQEAARTIANRTGNSYSATLNFEEFFNGSAQASTASGLNTIGDQRLFVVRDQEAFSFDVLPTPACVYSRDWFLGDKVTAKYLTITTTPKIVSVSVSVAKNGQETITPGLSYVG